MVTQAWIEKQVANISLQDLKEKLGISRFKLNRKKVVIYLFAICRHEREQKTFRSIFKEVKSALKIKYAAFMKQVGRCSRLSSWLFELHKEQAGIGFTANLHIIDSTLLKTKEEAHINRKDWAAGRVTVRTIKGKKAKNGQPAVPAQKVKICGEKALMISGHNNCIVFAQMMNSINSSDMNVLKQPMTLVNIGLHQGTLLADKGFSCMQTRKRFTGLAKVMPSFKVKLIMPYAYNSKNENTPQDKLTYKKRWGIEEIFRRLKDNYQPFRLNLKGARRRALLRAKMYFSVLAWNWSKAPL
jgi:hypothetical protein